MNAANYPNIALSLLIKTIAELSPNQQILCKVIAIDRNGILKLQWIINYLDLQNNKITFFNRFPTKINIPVITKIQAPKQESPKNIEDLIETETWAHKNKSQKIIVKNKYIGYLIDNVEVTQYLMSLPCKTTFLCKVIAIDENNVLQIEWKRNDSYNPQTDKINLKEWLNKKVWATIKHISYGNTKIFVDGSYSADFAINNKKMKIYINQLLEKLPEDQPILCRVLKIENNVLKLI
jgi:hypothetical protein